MIDLNVLVVYSSSSAINASSDTESNYPFAMDSARAAYNPAYAYFLDKAKSLGLKAALTTSEDVVGPGTCKAFWQFSDGKWSRVKEKAKANQIFDKIAPISQKRLIERQLLVTDKEIVTFNDSKLFYTFFDKFKTYKELKDYSIPTVAVASSNKKDVEMAVNNLNKIVKNCDFPDDFASEFVLKDRFGTGGHSVFKIEGDAVKEIEAIMKQDLDKQFILQPLLKFDQGFTYKREKKAADIRLVFHHNKILQSYIRLAKDGDFRCNEHQGGQSFYLKNKEIPKEVFKMAMQMVEELDCERSLYALDFALSNLGNPYLVEGNYGPGIYWNAGSKIEEKKSKQLIDSIVEEIASRI